MARLVPALLGGLQLPEVARPHLTRLASELQETVNVAILQGDEIVYLLSETANRLLTPRVMVGMRLPAHCTALGKCLLAQLPDEVAQSCLGDEPYERLTDRTITSWKALTADLAEIRRAGVAVSEEEYEIGLISIAVPVSSLDGPGTASVNASLPAPRATPEFRASLTEGLLEAARAIDREMGMAGARW
jgi:IclR family acetate operon transcriptional repressor